jgi:hypothetical protein
MAQDFENVKMARAREQAAVRTTIVGSRPPGSGQAVGDIPRGVEVLIKKAAVDAAFRERLLKERAGAAALIGLRLDRSEAAMLTAIPADQLDAIVSATRVPSRLHGVFMGAAAAAMLAAVGASSAWAEGPDHAYVGGAAPDEPKPFYYNDDEQWLASLEAPDDAGAVAGVVTAFDGKPLAGARVQVVGTTLTATTDENGRYFIPRAGGAKVAVTCAKDGFQPATRDAVTLKDGYVTRVNFGLALEPPVETGARPDFDEE